MRFLVAQGPMPKIKSIWQIEVYYITEGQKDFGRLMKGLSWMRLVVGDPMENWPRRKHTADYRTYSPT